MSEKIANAGKFRKVRQARGIHENELNDCIDKHVQAEHPSNVREQTVARSNLRKELNGDSMNEKLLKKALRIIGLSGTEVTAVLNTA